MEKWKKLDLDSRYEISYNGNLRSYKKKGGGVYENANPRKPVKDKKGYLRVNLSVNGKIYNRKIHRLVAEAFIPNPENKPQVNHIDGDKENNHFSNLEWVTNKENMAHAYSAGIRNNIGENNGRSILSKEDVFDIVDMLNDGIYQKDIAEKYGISQVAVSRIKKRKSWKHLNLKQKNE